MKNLLFLTAHRHIEEIGVYAKYLTKTNKIKNFDLILHVNKADTNIQSVRDYFALIPNKNKHLIITDINISPHGLHKALSDFYPLLKEYDNVIHSHPDVYIYNEDAFLEKLYGYPDKTFIVNYSLGSHSNQDWMSTDIFFFKPKDLKTNIFDNWKKYYGLPVCNLPFVHAKECNTHAPICEQFLYWQVINNNYSYIHVKRFDNDHGQDPRRVCMWGCYHEHDLNKAIDLIKNKTA